MIITNAVPAGTAQQCWQRVERACILLVLISSDASSAWRGALTGEVMTTSKETEWMNHPRLRKARYRDQ
jgi:hypothetical protein